MNDTKRGYFDSLPIDHGLSGQTVDSKHREVFGVVDRALLRLYVQVNHIYGTGTVPDLSRRLEFNGLSECYGSRRTGERHREEVAGLEGGEAVGGIADRRCRGEGTDREPPGTEY